MSEAPAELADRLTRRRARVSPVLAILFITQQGAYLANAGAGNAGQVKLGAWVVLSVVLLVALATGGGWLRSREVRALMNDETTRAHRASAVVLGFWATMITGVILFVLAAFRLFDVRDAIHIMMTVGIASALIRFASLERRALA